MRILLDECLDRRLARELRGHEVRTVPEMGWASYNNGLLLSLAQQQFDVFLTTDKNLPYQRDVSKYQIAVLIFDARTNRLADLRPLLPKLLEMIDMAKKGEAAFVRP